VLVAATDGARDDAEVICRTSLPKKPSGRAVFGMKGLVALGDEGA
jgi:hypothetical protein